MSAIASWPLQKAIFTRLGANGNTSSYTVVDNKDVDTYPYISIGATTVVEESNKTNDGADETFLLHVWATNNMDCKEIAANIDRALKASALDLTADGYTALAKPRLAIFEVFDESDPRTGQKIRHGVLRFRFMITDAT